MGEHDLGGRNGGTANGHQRVLLADLGRTRAHVQATAVSAPVLRQQMVDVAPSAAAARRGRERAELLERGARQNLLAAQEARHVLAQVYQRLLEECAARAELEQRFAELSRETARLRDEDESRAASHRSNAMREARAIAASELAEATTELDRLRELLEHQDFTRRDFDTRLRKEREERRIVEASLERAEAAREAAQCGLDRATETVTRRVEEETARTQAFEQLAAELTRERDRLRAALESHPSATELEQLASDLDERDTTIAALRTRIDGLECALADACDDREAQEASKALESALDHARVEAEQARTREDAALEALAQVRAERVALEQVLEHERSARAPFEDRFRELEGAYAEAVREVSSVRADRAALEGELVASREDRARLEEELGEIRARAIVRATAPVETAAPAPVDPPPAPRRLPREDLPPTSDEMRRHALAELTALASAPARPPGRST
jgi:hypothetical protein